MSLHRSRWPQSQRFLRVPVRVVAQMLAGSIPMSTQAQAQAQTQTQTSGVQPIGRSRPGARCCRPATSNRPSVRAPPRARRIPGRTPMPWPALRRRRSASWFDAPRRPMPGNVEWWVGITSGGAAAAVAAAVVIRRNAMNRDYPGSPGSDRLHRVTQGSGLPVAARGLRRLLPLARRLQRPRRVGMRQPTTHTPSSPASTSTACSQRRP